MKCDLCGQSVKPTTYTLHKSLSMALRKIANSGQTQFNTKTLRDANAIGTSDFTNMTHLRYLGLVKKVLDEGGERAEGRLWEITELGVRYLNGEKVPKSVTVVLKEVVDKSKEMITISEATGYYQPPEYWATQYQQISKDQMEMEL